MTTIKRTALTTLTRLARRRPENERYLVDALSGRTKSLALDALTVATQTGDPIGRALATRLTTDELPMELAEALLRRCDQPQDIDVNPLWEIGLLATRRVLIDRTARQTAPANRAALHLNLANRLGMLGRAGEAIPEARAAVTLYQSCADRPNEDLDVANARMALAVWLRAADQPEVALDAISAARATFERAVVKGDPESRSDLALATDNRANILSDLDLLDEAVAESRVTVTMYRALAHEQQAIHHADLARALNNLGNKLAARGDYAEACELALEAVAIQQPLAYERPEAFLPNLAMFLHNLARYNWHLDQPAAAIDFEQQAVATRSALADMLPKRFLSDLARSHNSLGVFLRETEKLPEALDAFERAKEIWCRLPDVGFDHSSEDLAMTLQNIGSLHAEIRDPEQGLQALRQAVSLYEQLTEKRPIAYGPRLAGTAHNISLTLRRLERLEDALRWSHRALRALAPQLSESPHVYATRIDAMLDHYRTLIEETGSSPDESLIESIVVTQLRYDEVSADEEIRCGQ